MIDLATPSTWQPASVGGAQEPDADGGLERDIELAWEVGELSWLLHESQLEVYEQYRAWDAALTDYILDESVADELDEEELALERIFLLDIGRRWGKTTLILIIMFEDAIRRPGSRLRYSTAYAKDIVKIVKDVERYILSQCPLHLKPRWLTATGDREAGWYWDNGSQLVMIGLDKNPDGHRGTSSDGEAISEAAFVDKLEDAVISVLYPQFQGRPHARMILESSAPKAPDTIYDKTFVADAQRRGAYAFRTIEDNPLLTERQRKEFYRAAGGRSSERCKREYFNVRVRDPEQHVVPEFDRDQHVRRVERPDWFDGYIGMDSGLQDLMAIVGCYLHPETKELVVEGEWARRNASTGEVAEALAALEETLWGDSQRWDLSSRAFKPQPYMRISDTDMRLIYDLNVEHGFDFSPVDRARRESDGRTRRISEAMIHAVRNAFRDGWVVIDPSCEQTIAHLLHAKWNERRTDWERHDVYGHYDLVAALSFVIRHVERNREPIPPPQVLDPSLVTIRRAEPRLGTAQVSGDVKSVLNGVTGGKKRWQRQRVKRRR